MLCTPSTLCYTFAYHEISIVVPGAACLKASSIHGDALFGKCRKGWRCDLHQFLGDFDAFSLGGSRSFMFLGRCSATGLFHSTGSFF